MTDTDSTIEPADELEVEQAREAEKGAAPDPEYSATDEDAPADDLPEFANRFLAGLIDGVMAGVVSFVPLIGLPASATYMVLRDGLDIEVADGRSVGKKIMGLRPIRLDGGPMDLETSVRRNWMFGFGAVIWILLLIPILGWFMALPVSLVGMGFGLFEVYKLFTDPQQRRFGDHMAGTRVVTQGVSPESAPR